MDRGKPGTKRHVLTDATGIVLVVLLSAANVHDSLMLGPVLDAWQGVQHGDDEPTKAFEKLHADKAYDTRNCMRLVRQHGMESRIARRGIESNEKLGRHRWVVERTMSWFDDYRKIRIRDERNSDHFLALHKVAAIDMNWKRLANAG